VAFNVTSHEQRDRQLRRLRMVDQTAGLIIISLFPTDEDIAALQRAGVAVVLLDAEHPAATRVVVDDVHGGELAAEHLLSLGHERIAFVGDDWPHGFEFRAAGRRYAGYESGLRRAGVTIRREYYRRGPYTRATAQRLTGELLALPEPPTAIFAASDTQALGVIEAVTRSGLAVPGEVSVVGFDDLEIAAYVGLTTVRQPLYESGRKATQLMVDLIGRRQQPGIEELLPLELVVRTTTAPPS